MFFKMGAINFKKKKRKQEKQPANRLNQRIELDILPTEITAANVQQHSPVGVCWM